jgi:alkylation response protein AidB-like acyl-CoA dehydrogenase
MNFGFTEEQELLRKTARALIDEQAPLAVARGVLERGESHSVDLWRRFAELGWTGLGIPEIYGGAGLSLVELCILVEELGRNLVPVPFVSHAIAAIAVRELGSAAQRERILPRIASGVTIGTVCLPSIESGADSIAAAPQGAGFHLNGVARFVADASSAALFVVPANVGGQLGLFVVPRDARGVGLRPLQALDALRPLYEVTFDRVEIARDAWLGEGTASAAAIESLTDRALVVISAEMLGGAERCLETSVQYAKQRVQFGKPIGIHQAIKHKCADMLFAVEAARSITYYAAWAAREARDDAGVFASMAKATAGEAFRRAATDNLQIHGGVGFTWEYDCHLLLRRARSDEAWLGGASFHRERIARLGFGAAADRAAQSA